MAMVDGDVAANVATATRLVREAAKRGARLILVPELFEDRYFCEDQR
ncbi:MAG: N-carbamoylputrescine amidase, partial [Acidimicrobiia bacterium]|nr:N-carbamoylputrescine amidase [Acidimicrobiia bacterium]